MGRDLWKQLGFVSTRQSPIGARKQCKPERISLECGSWHREPRCHKHGVCYVCASALCEVDVLTLFDIVELHISRQCLIFWSAQLSSNCAHLSTNCLDNSLPRLTYHRKTFLVPEIIYDPNLLLSPHVFLLAILFKNRAFEAETLNDNPRLLSTLKIHPKANQLRLGLKKELGSRPLFRRSVKRFWGYEMSENGPITQSMTGEWIKSIGRLLGFEHSTISYTLRYFAGNSLDQNGECCFLCFL